MRWKRTITVVDCHAAGENGKVVTGGVHGVPGKTAFDKRVYLEQHLDDLRKLLLFEPRGTVNHNANLILPSNHPDADMAYVIMESTEYPVMSGSNTMCVTTVLLETGILPMQEPVTRLTLESPAGLIGVDAECADGKVTRVRFTNQPAFCYSLDQPITVEGLGEVVVDIAYGGMTYVVVDAHDLGFGLVPSEGRELVALGERLKAAAAAQLPVSHPENEGIPGITNTIFAGPVYREGEGLRARNTVVVAPGRLDRSPCGTGTSARLAVMHAKGEIEEGQMFVHESIIGTEFYANVVDTTAVGPFDAIVSQVAGTAWITALSQIGLDPTDPFPEGFTVSDLWLRELA